MELRYTSACCGYEVSGMILLRFLRGEMRLDRSKVMSMYVSLCTSYDFNTLTPVGWKLWRWKDVCFYDWFLEQPINTKFYIELSLQTKHDAFNISQITNDKICNGSGRHPQDTNQKWRKCFSLSSISRAQFTLNSFHKPKQSTNIIFGNTEVITWSSG
jgi:hypothetical protein